MFPLLLARPAATDEAARVRDAVQRTLEEMGMESAQVAQTRAPGQHGRAGLHRQRGVGRFRNHPQSVVDADFERLLTLLRGFVEPEPADSGPAVHSVDTPS